ncbi:hypothetical protein BpHYR1_024028 [Brachionus plicatilis]|uniref:Uncharacterized protein n=1 Tax=Brachionus plicatilis TaxID=10195 RepID=A0A3M7SI76_BRAPC|nr:hypothetical protein BpHYR1_024028 [Brachionus plicatilis]
MACEWEKRKTSSLSNIKTERLGKIPELTKRKKFDFINKNFYIAAISVAESVYWWYRERRQTERNILNSFNELTFDVKTLLCRWNIVQHSKLHQIIKVC